MLTSSSVAVMFVLLSLVLLILVTYNFVTNIKSYISRAPSHWSNLDGTHILLTNLQPDVKIDNQDGESIKRFALQSDVNKTKVSETQKVFS